MTLSLRMGHKGTLVDPRKCAIQILCSSPDVIRGHYWCERVGCFGVRLKSFHQAVAMIG